MITKKRSIWLPLKILVLPLAASVLTACTGSLPSSSVPVDLPPLPARYETVSCVPTPLPKGALTQAQVETLWAKDRTLLKKCGYSLGGLIAFYTDLQVRLLGAKTR